jgi:leucyl aminopeptidase
MVVLRHQPKGAADQPHLCLVGKGLTFDTGGVSLKTSPTMWEMICDMSGAAAVLAAMKAVAQAGVPLRVTGILVCSQNYIDRKSVLPGDIFVAKNGKSITVNNTDAEGRLILTDGLCRAGEEGATHIVDIATLTGACQRALGDSLSGLFSNDEELAARLLAIGEATGEQMCRFPLHDEYRTLMDHFRSDICNISKSANGGAITAALFLREFVPEGARWAHLDIAGTAFGDSKWRYLGPGGRGVMARTLFALAREMAGEG